MASKARTSASRRATRRKTSRGKNSTNKASSKGGRSYKIGEVCRLLDIQPYVLNVWESEFPALEPTKSKSGQRSYSDADLEVVRRIKAMVYDEGLTLPGVRQRLEAEREQAGPEATEASSAAEKPSAKADLAAEKRPAAAKKPAAQEKPAARKKPADKQEHAAVEQTSVEKEPVAPGPVAKQQPAAKSVAASEPDSGKHEPQGNATEDVAAEAVDAVDKLDSQQAERIENLLRGVETALGQAREILSALK